ncbi:MAG: efflux RND transporter permease subunit [Proteobacteria bacterium]|nr:efflux RND transporter permease subunit [Pseudomonadota bacterium]
MNGLIKYFIKQPMLVNVITVMVVGFGIYSLFFIKREAFPNIDFDQISVMTIYPGASSETVEKLITAPLEEELRDVDGIKSMKSVSTQSTSIISLELDPDITTSDEARPDIQDVVDGWRDLPRTAEPPIVTAIKTKLFPVITVAIKGDADEEVLRSVAKSLEQPIEALSDVAKVRFEGVRSYEWHVDTRKALLQKWDVSLNEVLAAIRRNNQNIPGGSVWLSDKGSEGGSEEIILRTIGQLETKKDIENTVIRANLFGRPVMVKDVAEVRRGFVKRRVFVRTNGEPSQNVVVLKKEQGDIISLVEELGKLLEEKSQFFPEGVSYTLTDDSSYIVKRRLNVLTNNLIIGLVLVLIILSIALPIKIALISAFGIPFAFLAAMSLMFLLGVSVNIISMLGLILVVGMLVDDAVVVTENAQRAMERGLPPEEAAIQSTQEIWPPLLTSVTTTMMAFAPLLLMGGTLGKFIRFIPYGVLLGLAASLFECFFVLPNHIAHWIKDKTKTKKKEGSSAGETSGEGQLMSPKGIWHTRVLPIYERLMLVLIKLRYLVILVTIGMVVGTFFLFTKKMRFVMFPRGAIAEFTIRTEGKVGVPLSDTLKVITKIEQSVATLPPDELKEYTSVVGQYSRGARRGVTGNQYGQISVSLTEPVDRVRSADEIIDDLKLKIGELPGTKIRFSKRRAGPPVGRPVSIGVRGKDYQVMREVVEQVKAILAEQPGVSDITDSFTPGKKELHINVNRSEADAAGGTLREIGLAVQVAFEGVIATTVRGGFEGEDIRVRLDERDQNMKALDALTIANPRGQRIPLTKVATLEKRSSIASFEREDNRRQIVVEGDINFRENTPIKVMSAIKHQLDSLEREYPNISFYIGGEQRDTAENAKELLRVVLITLSGIFLMLILLFKNIFQPILISLTIPLAVIPVVWAFYGHGMTITFFALIGMVALAGVIVNNAIVLTAFINSHRGKGMENKASIIEACKTRLRPILLTTVTTVSGILPTAYGIGGFDPFVVPLAMSLGWGLALGSTLVCLIYPTIVAVFDDITKVVLLATSVVRRGYKA